MDRNLQSLCDRLNEVFNEDDTPDELSTEAREAIEELWEERDRLRSLNDALTGPSFDRHGRELKAEPEHQAQMKWARDVVSRVVIPPAYDGVSTGCPDAMGWEQP